MGIEGTAHTFGVGIVDDECHILANLSSSVSGVEGIHPREAANHHARVAVSLIKEALQISNLEIGDISLIAFSQGPGLGPCLRTAATLSRAISCKYRVPIVGVNHCIAHLEIGRKTTDCDDPVMLYASGGNTQVISYAGGRYRVFGETMDIGLGNFIDKLGRAMGMTFPCGPEMEKLALKGEKLIELPYSVKGMDVSFSGILTASMKYLKDGEKKENIAYSIQENVFAMIVEVSERAMSQLRKDELLLAGGVARNRRLRDMAGEMCKERNARMYYPADDLLVDNGAMIAWTGILMHQAGTRMKIEDTEIKQKFRTDEVDVRWRL